MKKFLAIVMAAIMILSVMSFASAELAGEYDITIWVAENAVDLTKQQIEDFNASNEDGIKFNATVEAVSEADAATQMIPVWCRPALWPSSAPRPPKWLLLTTTPVPLLPPLPATPCTPIR